MGKKVPVSFDNELYHFGIKGMRWGIRRYQNENGSLTEAGRRRYYKANKQDIDKFYSERLDYYRKQAKTNRMYDKAMNSYNKGDIDNYNKYQNKADELTKSVFKSAEADVDKKYGKGTIKAFHDYNTNQAKKTLAIGIGGTAATVYLGKKLAKRVLHSSPHSDELYHWGILGMKWGVRRYQNEDGSLTEAGRKRYGTRENFENDQHRKRARNKAMSEYAFSKSVKQGKGKDDISRTEKMFKDSRSGFDSTSSALRKIDRMKRNSKSKKSNTKVDRELKKMSNQEIQDYLRRADLERQYRQIREPERQSGLQKAADVLDIFGDVSQSVIATAAAATILYNGVKTIKKFKK